MTEAVHHATITTPQQEQQTVKPLVAAIIDHPDEHDSAPSVRITVNNHGANEILGLNTAEGKRYDDFKSPER